MIEKLSNVPQKPGVYLLKGPKDRVLYVGKAKNLKNRLKSYFQRVAGLDARKSSMIKNVKDFSCIVTDNELEALVLEANLIKQYKPRYNVILRDDKNYPYLKLTTNEEWPRLEVVRRIKKDGGLYFGPYVPAGSMWEAISFIRRNFLIRTCRYALDKPMRPCIQYQMGRCPAPCAGLISRGEYMKVVDEIRLFLQGEKKELLKGLEKKMEKFSEELKFEEAANIRDRINALKRVWESQKVVAPELGDIDVIGFFVEGKEAVFQVFFIRNGILIGARDFYLKDAGLTPIKELFHSFIEMFYAKEIIPPEEIIVGNRPEDSRSLTAWLTVRRGSKVKIVVPCEGKRLELLKMADENARLIFRNKKEAGVDETLKALKERLKLSTIPMDIGAFDVSTIYGSESVGAFVYWSEGEFKKDIYRHFKIKTVSGIDDYAMMDEIIVRALKNFGDKLPDLIIIDGGKGQLEIAKRVLDKHHIVGAAHESPALIAIAKDPDRAFTLFSDIPVDLEDGTPPSLLLKKIRDEVHRFAISYHRKLRDKRMMESPLEKVPGIGKKRRLALLRHFGSIDTIRNATVDEIASIKGLNKKVAERLLEGLGREQ